MRTLVRISAGHIHVSDFASALPEALSLPAAWTDAEHTAGR